jgi:hypothetical protein
MISRSRPYALDSMVCCVPGSAAVAAALPAMPRKC